MVQRVRYILSPSFHNRPERVIHGPPDARTLGTFCDNKLGITLQNSHWVQLDRFFEFNANLKMEYAVELRREVNVLHVLTTRTTQDEMKPSMRAGFMEYVWNGVLLPYSASREAFTEPNP